MRTPHPDRTAAARRRLRPLYVAGFLQDVQLLPQPRAGVPDDVARLVARIDDDHGRLDVLVNDIWGGELLTQWNVPLWEHDLEAGLRMLRLAVDTHLITSHHALPLLVRRPGGLVVEVTDGTLDYNAGHYRLSAFYDLAKWSVLRLAFSQAHELAGHGATAVTVTPGWLRSEMMLEHYDVTEANWRDATRRGTDPEAGIDLGHFAISESPLFVGRGIAALAADPDAARWNGRSTSFGELAQAYGVVDTDGSRPTPGATSSKSRTPENRLT